MYVLWSDFHNSYIEIICWYIFLFVLYLCLFLLNSQLHFGVFIAGFTVMFNASSCSGAEADGVIAVTVVTTCRSIITTKQCYNNTIRDSTIINPGEIEKTVLRVINPDCTREGSEVFNLTLSLDPIAMDLEITLGDPNMVVAEIEDTDSKQLENL